MPGWIVGAECWKRTTPILDLGCNAGYEARSLTRWGLSVVAADFSGKALELTRRRTLEAGTCNLDLTRHLPFPDAHFGALAASLSLHYLPWRQTVEILEKVRRCLAPGGHLLACLNSTRDARHAATTKGEIEPHLCLVRGQPKRLFDRGDIDALFFPTWTLEYAGEPRVATGTKRRRGRSSRKSNRRSVGRWPRANSQRL